MSVRCICKASFLTLSIAVASVCQAGIVKPNIPKSSSYDQRCFADVPPQVKSDQKTEFKDTPVSITADRMDAHLQDNVQYQGNVEIVHGNKVLKAENTTFNQATQDMSAKGNIVYNDGELTVRSNDELHTNLETNDTELYNADYHINGTLVRGHTKQATLYGQEKSITLKNATVTTCPRGEEAWHISSNEININQDDIFGESYHTVLWVEDIPVFYFPYLNFPIKNERKTGLLYPKLGYSSTEGLSYYQPVYFNIAPNYDMTFTPKIISHRGALLTNEFRYMPFSNTRGTLYGEYINHDKLVDRREEYATTERYYFSMNQSSRWQKNDVGLDINYARIHNRDYNYINDYSPLNANTEDNQLKQSIRAFADFDKVETSIEALRYQLLIPDRHLGYQPYSLLPRVDVKVRDVLNRHLAYQVHGEISNFRAEADRQDQALEAQRFHLEPSLMMPLYNENGIELTANGRLFYTYYNQQVPDTLNNRFTRKGFRVDNIKESTDRFLYMGEMHGKMTFINRLDNGQALTLEPELQYMYIPYKNQDSIGVYDTTDHVYDFYSLFTFHRYAGIDRISDTNRISYSLSHRLYDSDFKERLRINVGQAYDFVPQRVKLYPNDNIDFYSRTPISAMINAHIVDGLTTHWDMVYDTDKSHTSSWAAQINGQLDGASAQLNYRYTRDGNRSLSREIVDVKQLGLLTKIPVTNDLTLIGVAYRDLEQKHDIDKKLALKYESCCYSIGFQVERYYKPDNVTLTAEQETTFGVFFELKGLANVGGSSDFSTSTKLLPHNNTVNLNN